jgi:AraC family transcriptional activator of pobA
MQSRAEHLFVSVTRGHGKTVLHGVRHGIAPNTVLFVPAGTLFSLSLSAHSQGALLSIPQNRNIALPGAAHWLRLTDLYAQRELVALLDAMQREQDAARDFHGEAADAHATLLAIWLRRVLRAQPPAPEPRADQRLAAAFCDLVAQEYQSGAPMQAYATRLGVSPAYLARACKSSAGMSAAAMLTARSLHAARRALEDDSNPVGRIAEDLGFRSAAYFTRFVRRHTGLTPSQIRSDAPHPPR